MHPFPNDLTPFTIVTFDQAFKLLYRFRDILLVCPDEVHGSVGHLQPHLLPVWTFAKSLYELVLQYLEMVYLIQTLLLKFI